MRTPGGLSEARTPRHDTRDRTHAGTAWPRRAVPVLAAAHAAVLAHLEEQVQDVRAVRLLPEQGVAFLEGEGGDARRRNSRSAAVRDLTAAGS